MRNFAGAIVAVILLLAGIAAAKDQNGVSVTVSKSIAWQPVPAGVAGADHDLRIVQTLALVAKNTSIRPFPEGTVEWTLLLRNAQARPTKHPKYAKYTGTEKLLPLGRLEIDELPLGVIAVGGRQVVEPGRIEYEVIISHDGKETMRIASTSGFAELADEATPPVQEGAVAAANRELRRMKRTGRTGENASKQPDTEKGSSPPDAPASEIKLQTLPAVASEPRKPSVEFPPAAPQAFDFFNLGGKKTPGAK